MRTHGICYSTGFVLRGINSRESFDQSIVRREMEIIRDDLHCTSVRVIGGDADRIATASSIAAELGMEVWVSPYPLDLDHAKSTALIRECAIIAEQLRQRRARVVLVAGAELSLMIPGFLPGETLMDRVDFLRRRENLGPAAHSASTRLNEFLSNVLAVVRSEYQGKVTYASTPLEDIDWAHFDFVSVDLYRSAEIVEVFETGVRQLVERGMPVAITEFGAATWEGASAHGALGGQIVEHDPVTGWPVRLEKVVNRDEQGQANEIRDLLKIFEAAGVDSTFVFTFELADHTHRPDDDIHDLDRASYGIVKPLAQGYGNEYPGMTWEPKVAFTAVAEFHRSHSTMERIQNRSGAFSMGGSPRAIAAANDAVISDLDSGSEALRTTLRNSRMESTCPPPE